MKRYIAESIAASLLVVALSPAQAGVIHKWVDSDGVTHYADAPPEAATSPVTRIDLPETTQAADSSDYYSIINQWRRLHQERLELERIRLEQARIKSLRESAEPAVVVIEQSDEIRPIVIYPKYRPRYRRVHRRHKHQSPASTGSIPRNWLAQQQRGGLYQPPQRRHLY